MIRSTILRVIAFGAGLTAPLSGPATAIAHGHAHSEAAEHSAHHAAAAGVSATPIIDADEHDVAHGHPRLDPSTVTRAAKDLQPGTAVEPVLMVLADNVTRDSTPAPIPNESPPDRPSVSPALSRAPPVL